MKRPRLTHNTPGMFVESGMKFPMPLSEAMNFRPFPHALFLAHGGKHVYTPREVEKALAER